MPAITQKQEAFCQAIVSGSTQIDAYRNAGYSTKETRVQLMHEEACKLMKTATIINRLAELREPAVRAAGMTLESHLADLQRLRNMAVKDKQYSAAISAETSRGRAAGFYVDKKEIRTGLIDGLDFEQLKFVDDAIESALKSSLRDVPPATAERTGATEH